MKHKHTFQFVEMLPSRPFLDPSDERIHWSKSFIKIVCLCGKVKMVEVK